MQNSMEFSLIFKAISHLLDNQVRIMRDLCKYNTYAIDATHDLAAEYGKLAKEYWKNQDEKDEDRNNEPNVDGVIRYLDELKKNYPDQVIMMETPFGVTELKIGKASIYEGMNGEIIIDSE